MAESIIDRRMLLGAGALALAVPASRANAALRPLYVTNVKSFGARGNGSADDTNAIQRAVNWTSAASRGTIFFPVGTYRITKPITFESRTLHISFLGEPGAVITGNFASALLRRSVRSPIAGVHVIENLRFINHHPSGKGAMFHSCRSGKIVNCQFDVVGTAIEAFNSKAITIDTCTIRGSKVGIMAGNATTVLDCSITGCAHGIRHHNVGLTVHGGRYEANNVAIKVGYDQNDRGVQSSGFDIAGLSMESNQTSIQIGTGTAGQISACSIGGRISMAHGLCMLNPQDVVVTGVTVAGARGFTTAGIRIASPARIVLVGVRSSSSKAWLLPSNQRQLTFIQTNKS